MNRLPLGVSRLDRLIGGGAPAGSVVLLAGEAGAGAREFDYTNAVFNGLADAAPDEFDRYYGDLESGTAIPESVHYVSFTDERAAIVDEMGLVMDDALADAGTGDVVRADEREIREIDKGSYCHQCEHFAEPPTVACTREGTAILELPSVETFRVADCRWS